MFPRCKRHFNTYSLFLKLRLGPLQPAPFSLQLAYGSETQPLRKFEDVPVKIGDI